MSLLLVVVFAAGFAADLVHTDDGCQVELHCIACQRLLTSVGVAAVPPARDAPVEPVGRVAAAAQLKTHEPDEPTAGSRAPPLG